VVEIWGYLENVQGTPLPLKLFTCSANKPHSSKGNGNFSWLNLFLVVQHVFAVLFWNSLLQRVSRVFQVFKLKTVRLGAFCSLQPLVSRAEEIQHFH